MEVEEEEPYSPTPSPEYAPTSPRYSPTSPQYTVLEEEKQEEQENIQLYRDAGTYKELLDLLIPLIRNSTRVEEPILKDATFWSETMARDFPELCHLALALLQEPRREMENLSRSIGPLVEQLCCIARIVTQSTSVVATCVGRLNLARDQRVISRHIYAVKFFSSKVTTRCTEDINYARRIARLYRASLPFALPHHSFYFENHARIRRVFFDFIDRLGFLLVEGSPYETRFHGFLTVLLRKWTPSTEGVVSFPPVEEMEEAFRYRGAEEEETGERGLLRPVLNARTLSDFFNMIGNDLLNVRGSGGTYQWIQQHWHRLINIPTLLQQLIDEADAITEDYGQGNVYVPTPLPAPRYTLEDATRTVRLTYALYDLLNEAQNNTLKGDREILAMMGKEGDYILPLNEQRHCFNIEKYRAGEQFTTTSLTLHIVNLCDQNIVILVHQRAQRCRDSLTTYFKPGLVALLQDFRGFILYQFSGKGFDIPPPDYPEGSIYIDDNAIPTGLNRLTYAIWFRSGLFELLDRLDLEEPVLCDAIQNWKPDLVKKPSRHAIGNRVLLDFLRHLRQIIQGLEAPRTQDLLRIMSAFASTLTKEQNQRYSQNYAMEDRDFNNLVEKWKKTYPYQGNDDVVMLYLHLLGAARDIGLEGVFPQVPEENAEQSRKRLLEPELPLTTSSLLGSAHFMVLPILVQNMVAQQDVASSRELFNLIQQLLLVAKFSQGDMRPLFSNAQGDSNQSGYFWLRCIGSLTVFYHYIVLERGSLTGKERTSTLAVRPIVSVVRTPTPVDALLVESEPTLVKRAVGLSERHVTMTKEETITTDIQVVTQWQLVRQPDTESLDITEFVLRPLPRGLEDLNIGQLFHLASLSWNKEAPKLVSIIRTTLWFPFNGLRGRIAVIWKKRISEDEFYHIISLIAETVLFRHFQEPFSLSLSILNTAEEYYVLLRDTILSANLQQELYEIARYNQKLPDYLRSEGFFGLLFETLRDAILLEGFQWSETQPDYLVEALREMISYQLDQLFQGTSVFGFSDPSEINFIYKIYTFLVVNRYYYRHKNMVGIRKVRPYQNSI